MDFFFYITIIVALSFIYGAYEKKKNHDLRKKEIELEHRKLDLQMIDADRDSFDRK
ncbi:hypothetical protein LCL89_02210 [Halobacillus yeomjeoni]|uniref:Sporulation protein n=1 Tax=Halobacillus yeomjeoni TaxID=311194 RepID=A0A931MUQ0_9BACI|nr:hypothetical protein [Halobacillus yeomjeoni]MBH0229770.1 hypothetical protein [Halobacillus yeomjeoni]MCA0982853.1 hypothetical protein [Halobacillus yeomjeoni]